MRMKPNCQLRLARGIEATLVAACILGLLPSSSAAHQEPVAQTSPLGWDSHLRCHVSSTIVRARTNETDRTKPSDREMVEDEDRTRVSFWCVLAAPQIADNDLAQDSQNAVAVLTNPEIIAADQDSAGILLVPSEGTVPVHLSKVLMATPDWRAVSAGSTAGYTVTAAPGTFKRSATLSVSGLPPGATASFDLPSLGARGSSTMALSVDSSTPAGTYTLTISASDGTASFSITVTLKVYCADPADLEDDDPTFAKNWRTPEGLPLSFA